MYHRYAYRIVQSSFAYGMRLSLKKQL